MNQSDQLNPREIELMVINGPSMGNQILYRMSGYGHFCSGISFMCLDVSVYPEDTVGLRNS